MQLDPGLIEERFNCESGEGCTIECFGDSTMGMSGFMFIYTNRDTLSVGGGALRHFFTQSAGPSRRRSPARGGSSRGRPRARSAPSSRRSNHGLTAATVANNTTATASTVPNVVSIMAVAES